MLLLRNQADISEGPLARDGNQVLLDCWWLPFPVSQLSGGSIQTHEGGWRPASMSPLWHRAASLSPSETFQLLLLVFWGHCGPGPGLGSWVFEFCPGVEERGVRLPHRACLLQQACAHSEAGMPSCSLPGWLAPEMSYSSFAAWAIWTGNRSVHLSRWFPLSFCRTRRMGSQRPSSSKMGRRKARSTGKEGPARSSLPCALLQPPVASHVLPALRPDRFPVPVPSSPPCPT